MLVPFFESPIPSIESGNRGQPVRDQIMRSFVGLAGESRNNDANTPVFHIQGVNPTNLTAGRLEPAAPPNPNMPPEHRPDVACETQQPPNLAAPGGSALDPAPHVDDAMKMAIRKHWREFLAVLGLIVLAARGGGLHPQPAGLPLPARRGGAEAHLDRAENAQAVEPGQGQTVRVAGVEVGGISASSSRTASPSSTSSWTTSTTNLIREDATALLRPKTALKDMFLEVIAGHRPRGARGRRTSRVANTLPDVDPDEISRALDADTRPYLKLLIVGRGQGPARARRGPARGVPAPRARAPRPGPRHARDRRAPARGAQAAHPPLRRC